ncbi:MAG TPA: PQQ-binding-like beta-propeller repeat protein [Actinomycetota bacterium]|nr:PQQ-binding-like beta-propeller repeat protein [Actinomycetota bacterium]
MRPFRIFRPSRRALIAASIATAAVAGLPLAALADWPQFQGRGTHDGSSDGPSAPFELAWRNDDIDITDGEITGGLSAPVVAEDGTVVVVGPHEVLTFDGGDGAETRSTTRHFGPASQPAIAEGTDGPIAVFTEGFGDDPPPTSATPSPSPAVAPDGEDGFDSHVRALTLEDGQDVWETPVELTEIVQAPVATDETTAYVADVGGTVTAIDLDTGEVRWTADVNAPVASAVAVDDDAAYVATVGEQQTPGEVVALDPSNGEELWRSGDDAVLGNIVSAPTLSDGRIFVLEPGFVVAVDPDDGGLLWRTEIVNPRTAPFARQGVGGLAPASTDGQVVAVDVTGRVYALDAETGALTWDHALNDASTLGPPLLTEDHVLVPANSGTLYAVDRASGHLVSRFESEETLLRGLADGGDVLVAVAGFEEPRLLAFAEDPSAALIDEPSPTTLDVGELLAGFALGALPVAIAAVALTRPLHRRLWSATGPTDVLDRRDDG